ncbi:MAG: undecaprenyl-diphosphate phosphatase [Planctomycetota bacterium]
MLEAALYGLVQGLTEFLPISSSGHLALYSAVIEAEGRPAPLFYSVLVHVASLLAVLVVFRREAVRLVGRDRRLGGYILLATVPAVLAGVLLHGLIEEVLAGPGPVACCLIVTGAALIAGEWAARRRAGAAFAEQRLTALQAVAVGVAQAAALLPGVSRSGMTISAGRALGLDRGASVRFAFLLGIPAIGGAGLYEALNVAREGMAAGVAVGPSAAAAFVVSLASSWAALVLLIRLVRRVGLWVFAPYCFLLAGVVLVAV